MILVIIPQELSRELDWFADELIVVLFASSKMQYYFGNFNDSQMGDCDLFTIQKNNYFEIWLIRKEAISQLFTR